MELLEREIASYNPRLAEIPLRSLHSNSLNDHQKSVVSFYNGNGTALRVTKMLFYETDNGQIACMQKLKKK